jgi:hypothetical protein
MTTVLDVVEAINTWHLESPGGVDAAIEESVIIDITKKHLMNVRIAGRSIGSCAHHSNHSRVRLVEDEKRNQDLYFQIHQW